MNVPIYMINPDTRVVSFTFVPLMGHGILARTGFDIQVAANKKAIRESGLIPGVLLNGGRNGFHTDDDTWYGRPIKMSQVKEVVI